MGQGVWELGREGPGKTMAFSALAWVACGHLDVGSLSLFQTLGCLITRFFEIPVPFLCLELF